MRRYIGIVEEIDWEHNRARIRVPNRDGFTTDDEYLTSDSMLMRQIRTPTENLSFGDIPRHLQGLRVNDVVLCLDDQVLNSELLILGFFGGTM